MTRKKTTHAIVTDLLSETGEEVSCALLISLQESIESYSCTSDYSTYQTFNMSQRYKVIEDTNTIAVDCSYSEEASEQSPLFKYRSCDALRSFCSVVECFHCTRTLSF